MAALHVEDFSAVAAFKVDYRGFFFFRGGIFIKGFFLVLYYARFYSSGLGGYVQGPVNCCKPGFFTGKGKFFRDFFCCHVAAGMLFKAVQDESPGLCIVIGIQIENDNHSQMYCQGGGNWLRLFKPCGGGGFFCF